MIHSSNRLFSVALVALAATAMTFSSTSNALTLTKSSTTSLFKVVPDKDLVCAADDGELDVNASTQPDGTITFLMESTRDSSGVPVSHTCCEVPHGSGLTVAQCEAGDPSCTCGEFTLDQKVEDPVGGDNVPSNCLQESTTGGLETYRCVVTKGAPREYWVWHLNKVMDSTYDAFCGNNASSCSGCGVAMGTTDNAKPGEYPPFGIVWQYDQYTKNGQVLLADFNGNWCHTGSFCLDDAISCDVKSAKLDLRTTATANFTIVEVDTVQTFNGNSTSGNVPTDFLSTADAGTLLVDPNQIDITSMSINGTPVTVIKTSSGTDRNGDGFNDLRTNISQADYQHALYPAGGCVPDATKAVVFRGTFIDGRAWVGPTTVNVVCN
jgi:hypothetical protein